MRHANSNLNILKKNPNTKNIKLNNFLKPPSSSNNVNSPMTTKNANNKNILYNLLYKDNSKISLNKIKNKTNTHKNTNEISISGGGKNKTSNIIKFNNSISIGNSKNYKGKKIKDGNINIRLKLNNQIINNNFNIKNKSKNKTINFNMIEKIKEKDSQINKLQKELFQSQELLNKLQKDKQKELSFTYNSIKSLDNLNNLSKDYLINEFFIPTTEKSDKICKTNFNKFEMNKSIKKKNNFIPKNNNKGNFSNKNSKNLKSLLKIDSLINININYKNKNKRNNKNNNKNSNNNNSNKNSLSSFYKNYNQTKKYKYNFPTSNYLRCFSSSANRFFSHGHRQYESCISLTRNTISRKDKKLSIEKEDNAIYKSLLSSKLKSKHNFPSQNLKNLITKCNSLKERANKILSNYISLTEYVINIKNENK